MFSANTLINLRSSLLDTAQQNPSETNKGSCRKFLLILKLLWAFWPSLDFQPQRGWNTSNQITSPAVCEQAFSRAAGNWGERKSEKPSFPLSLPSPRDFFSPNRSLFTGYSSCSIFNKKWLSHIVSIFRSVWFEIGYSYNFIVVFYCAAKRGLSKMVSKFDVISWAGKYGKKTATLTSKLGSCKFQTDPNSERGKLRRKSNPITPWCLMKRSKLCFRFRCMCTNTYVILHPKFGDLFDKSCSRKVHQHESFFSLFNLSF